MRLLSFMLDGRTSFGAVVGDGVIDLGARLDGRYGDLRDALADDALAQLSKTAAGATPDHSLDDIQFLRPIPFPEKVICVGVNYANRNEEYKDSGDPSKYPSIFMRAPDSLVAHGAPLLRPTESDQLDYEAEIALVIGKGGKRIPEASAMDHVAGISCMNEGAIRDWMRHGKFNVTQGKNFDGCGAFGPWLVTADAIAQWDDIRVSSRVNGETRQDDTTANLIFGFAYLISYISTYSALKPGDVIATGTPTGAGVRFDPPRFLRAGDEVEIEVSGVGILKNTVIDET